MGMASGTNATSNTATTATAVSRQVGRICPSDWDKRETPVVTSSLEGIYDGRLKTQRRGQDSNLRTSFPVTDLANPRFRPLSHLSQLFALQALTSNTMRCLEFA